MAIPDPMLSIRTMLLAHAGVAAASGGRVFVPRLPRPETDNMPRAALVLTPSGGPGDRGTAPLGRLRVDARCYGASDLGAMALYYAVREAFKHMRRDVYAGLLLQTAVIEAGPMALSEPDLDWPLVLGVFEVTAAELAAV